MDTPSSSASGAGRYRSDPRALNIPWTESPFFEGLLEAGGYTEEQARSARQFGQQGFLLLEGLIEPELVDEVVGEFDRLFDPDAHHKAPPWAEEVLNSDPSRKQDAWYVSDPVKRLALHPRVKETLELLYGRRPVPFQTLDFLRGTEQSLHSDAFHFSSIPARFMCGVWVALEDITEDNGPLRYVPGSHLFPDIQLSDLGLWAEPPEDGLGPNYEVFEEYIEALLERHRIPVAEITCKKGSALFWASHLLHGGAPIRDPKSTRMSQVTHYYFEDCLYYTPAHSNQPLGELQLRNVYDIETGERQPHVLGGKKVLGQMWSQGRSRLHLAGPDGKVDIYPPEGYAPSGSPGDKLRRGLLALARKVDRRWGRDPGASS